MKRFTTISILLCLAVSLVISIFDNFQTQALPGSNALLTNSSQITFAPEPIPFPRTYYSYHNVKTVSQSNCVDLTASSADISNEKFFSLIEFPMEFGGYYKVDTSDGAGNPIPDGDCNDASDLPFVT